jgi:NADPH:quinone reductase
VIDLPTPKPSPNAYLIAVHAAATNFFDLLQIRGKYQHQPPLPWVAGAEFAGVILAAPTQGTTHKFRVGDRVFGSSQGSYATHVLAPEASLRLMPQGWDFMGAAGLMVTASTSYGGLVVRAGIQAGDWVLIHAAAGGVGLAAVQVAKARGATVVATAGTKRKLEVAKEFGADHVVDYKDPNWPDIVKKLTPHQRGVDIVYDPVGLVDKSLKCTAWGGRILIIGFVGGNIEKVAMNRVLLKNVSLVGLHWGTYAKEDPATVEKVWHGLEELMTTGKFRPTIFTDENFVGLERVGAALEMLGRRDTWGKVVVQVPHESASKL